MIPNYAEYIIQMIAGGHKSMILFGRPNESEAIIINITLDDPDESLISWIYEKCSQDITLVEPHAGEELIQAISEKIPSLNRDKSFRITINKGD